MKMHGAKIRFKAADVRVSKEVPSEFVTKQLVSTETNTRFLLKQLRQKRIQNLFEQGFTI